MKKALILGACVATIAAQSVYAQTVINTYRKLDIMPARYAKDGKATVYGYSWNESTRDINFFVYDENFKLIKEFSSLPETKFDYTRYVQEREDAYKDVEIEGYYFSDPLEEFNGYSYEQMLSYVKGYYPDARIVTLIDGKQAVTRNGECWYPQYYRGTRVRSDRKEVGSLDQTGASYPIDVFVKEGSSWYGADISYRGIDFGPYGDWGEAMEYKESRYLGVVDLDIISEEGADDQYFNLTNGIFGDGYAYIMAKGKVENFSQEDKDEDGFVYRKSWGQRVVATGWDVYDDKNTKITSVDMPSGYTLESDDLMFYRLGNNKFIGAEAEDASGHSVMVIYKLDDSNSSKVSQVAITPDMRVSPNAPHRGEKVKVVLGEPAVGNCYVQVVSVSGQVMYKGFIPAGVNEIDIDTHGFTAGMYIVNVVGDGVKKEAAKLIVR